MATHRIHTKTFPCGHTGKGTVCHRCAQQATIRQRTQTHTDERREQQRAWQRTFDDDPIDLRMLPHPHLVERARHILAALHDGADYRVFRGKCLRQHRGIISIPLGYTYRLLVHRTDAGVHPVCCDSHESYNKRRYA